MSLRQRQPIQPFLHRYRQAGRSLRLVLLRRAVRPTLRRLLRVPSRRWLLLLSALFLMALRAGQGVSQCSGLASTAAAASDCAAHAVPDRKIATLDPRQAYSLAELIDIAEHNNPQTRIIWESTKQRAKQLGIAKSEYYPVLVGIAAFADQRIIFPFPEALLPRGYSTVETPTIQPEITLQYLLFDFGKRGATVDAAKAEALAAGANFIQENQNVAFTVASQYYKLVTAQERLEASKETLKTAQTTQDAAEDRLRNGRATLPDVLNARAETSQAAFDLEAADGDENIARVTLAEAIGVEPSPNIAIDAQKNAPLPDALVLPIDELIERAMADRPDLAAQVSEIRAADDEVRSAKAEYRPKIVLSADGAQTAVWPTADNGLLGYANIPTWTASVGIEWKIFDGGARKNELAIAESKSREARDELTEKHDRAQREVWTAFIAFRTARRQEQAAIALLDSASVSYSASLDAYKYGVKNLVDVVTAEKQLALARLSSVSARSQLFLQAVQLEFATGNLLRNLPPVTRLQTSGGQKP
jgi:outer membrane protein